MDNMRHCGKDFDFHVENLKPKPNRYHFIDDSEGLKDKNLQFDLFRQTFLHYESGFPHAGGNC